MKVIILFAILLILLLTEISESSFDYNYNDYNYGPTFYAAKGKPKGKGEVKGHESEGKRPNVIQIAKCFFTCLKQFLNEKACNQMFPCLYDCFLPKESVSFAPELTKFEEPSTPPFSLERVYDVLKCAATCVKHHPITDWSSFAQVLYCLTDDCICYRMFPQQAKARAAQSKKPRKDSKVKKTRKAK